MKWLSTLSRLGLVGVVLCLNTPNSFAGLEDAEKAAEKARLNAIQLFGKFTQDKNVMGKPKLPDGTLNLGGDKSRFNKDDGVAYTSELTYHKNAYNVDQGITVSPSSPTVPGARGAGAVVAGPPVAAASAPPEPKKRRLRHFVSKHGGISAAGGSSILERKVFEFDDKYYKEDLTDSERRRRNEEAGIKEEGVFIVTKKEAEKPPAGAPPPVVQPGDPPDEKEKTDKAELKDEVRKAVEEVGTNSFKTVEKAAKDPESQDDPKALPWGLLLRDAAARALRSMRDEVTAALGQKRIYDTIRAGAIGKIEMNEDTPDCESAVRAKAEKELAQASPARKDRIQKDIERQLSQCKEVSKLKWREVQPVYEKDPNTTEEKLYSDGAQKEDGIQRDLRNQRMVIDKGGKDISELESNWKYDPQIGKNKIAVEYDQDGNVSRFEDWTGKDQLDDYNKQLKEADAALPEVNKRLGKATVPEFNAQQFQINPGDKTLDEIADIPETIREENFGPASEKQQKEKGPAETYDELINRQKAQD